MFEIDARAGRHAAVGLVGVAEEPTPRDGGDFLERGGIGFVGYGSEEQENGREGVRFGADCGGAQEVIDLGR